MISIEQMKAARALLDWTQDDLANAAGLSKPAINTLERRISNPRLDTLDAIQSAFERAGIEFSDGHGVRMRTDTLKTFVFEGEQALVRLYGDIFDSLSNSGKALLISGLNEEQYRFSGGARILEEVERRVKQKIPTKILCREGETHFIEPVSHYRLLPETALPAMASFVFDNKYALLLPGPPVKVAIIENAEIAEGFRQHFTALWHTAKAPLI